MKLFLFLSLCTATLFGQNVMLVPDYRGDAEDTIEVSVKISNTGSFVAFQTDIVLPSQSSYILNSAVLTSRSNGHAFSATLLPNNVLRMLAFSISQNAFLGDSGAVAKFKIKLKTEPAVYPVELVNPIISDLHSVNILTSFMNGSVTIVTPKINGSPGSLDFGSTPLRNSADRELAIQNIGNADLHVSRMYTGNGYFKVLGDTAFTIPAGSTRYVTVRFNSVKKGSYSTEFLISSNDPANKLLRIQMTALAFAVNEIHAQPVSGRSGYPVDVFFSMNNMERTVGFQFDIVLPDVLSFIPDSAFLSSRKQDHVISANYISPNRLRIAAFSPTNKSFSDSVGNLLHVKFNLDGTGGNHYYSLENVIISDSSAQNIVSAAYPSYVNIASPDIAGEGIISFGEVSVTDTAAVNYRLDNYGNDTLKIYSIASNNPTFKFNVSLPIIIPEGSFYQMPVHFHKNQKGVQTGKFSLRSNDPDEDPFYVNLTADVFIPNYISAKNVMGVSDDTVTLKISVENYEQFTAFQFDLQVPADFQYIANSARLTNRKQDHLVTIGTLGGDKYRIVAFSLSQKPFIGDSGDVVMLDFTAGNSAGNFPLQLSNGILSNAQSQNILKSTRNGEVAIYHLPTVPALLSPVNNSTNISINPTLTWHAGQYTDFYELQVAAAPSFTSLVLSDSVFADTSRQLTGLSFNTTYYWRVRAKNIAGYSGWSSVWNFTTVNGFLLSGSVRYRNSGNTPINNASVRLLQSGIVIDSALTNNTGEYSIISVLPGTYPVSTRYSALWGGVNSTDALQIRRYVAGYQTFDSLQVKAADVNRSSSVNSTDALLIRRRVAGFDTSFVRGNWTFEAPAVTITNAAVLQNILGLCTGDVNGSHVPGVQKTNPGVNFLTKGFITVQPNSELVLPIYVSTRERIGAVTLQFEYPEESFEIIGVSSPMDGVLFSAENGILTIAWDDVNGVSLNENEPLLKIIASVIKGQAADLKFKLTPEFSEIADIEANILQGVAITAPEIRLVRVTAYRLEQNYPNPFNPTTTIEYDVQYEGKVKIEIFNALGEVVAVLTDAMHAPGTYSVAWNAESCTSGVYYYRMSAQNPEKNFSQVKKLMLLK